VIAVFAYFVVFGFWLESIKSKLQSHSDEMLKLLYNDMKKKQHFHNIATIVV
jgi:hypothetical protein